MVGWITRLSDESILALTAGTPFAKDPPDMVRAAWRAFVASRTFPNVRDAWAAFVQWAGLAPSRSESAAPVNAEAALAALLA